MGVPMLTIIWYSRERITSPSVDNYGQGEDDFIFGPRHSRRHLAKVLSDTDFADDIALLSNIINHAHGLLYIVVSACNSVALYLNSPKNKVCCFCSKHDTH